MRKAAGWALLAVGLWMMVSPQAALGLEQLRWAAAYAFPGEVLLGAVVLSLAYYLVRFGEKRGQTPTNS